MEKRCTLDLQRPFNHSSGESHQCLWEKSAIKELIQEEAQQKKQLIAPSAAKSFHLALGEKVQQHRELARSYVANTDVVSCDDCG